MVHALAAIDEVAVDKVDRPVAALDDGWIVVAPFLVLLQMPRDGPHAALVLRERNRQAVAAALGVVVHQQPMPAGQPHAVDARAGIGQFKLADWSPGHAVVLGFTGSDFPQRAVLA